MSQVITPNHPPPSSAYLEPASVPVERAPAARPRTTPLQHPPSSSISPAPASASSSAAAGSGSESSMPKTSLGYIIASASGSSGESSGPARVRAATKAGSLSPRSPRSLSPAVARGIVGSEPGGAHGAGGSPLGRAEGCDGKCEQCTAHAAQTPKLSADSGRIPTSASVGKDAESPLGQHTDVVESAAADDPGHVPRALLLTLPRNCLSLIAYHLIATPSLPTRPASTRTLAAGKSDGPAYPSLPSTRDQAPLQVPRAASSPADLVSLQLTAKPLHLALSFDANPQLYHDLYRATFDHSALARRFQWMKQQVAGQSGGKKKAFDLFGDPRSWAVDYKTRWEMSKRMRRVVRRGTFELDGEGGKLREEEMVADLWNVWFLLTENDGKNGPFLAEQCDLEPWLKVYYRDVLLKDSLAPGYPEETGSKALALWCALLSGIDTSHEQTAGEVDEKIFTLRPYVFACAKYDITYAPWHHRQLPLCPPTCTCTKHTDPALRAKAIPYKRFGYSWRRAPPHFVLGAYLVFLRLLERQPHRLGSRSGSTSFSVPRGEPAPSGLFSTTRIMPSIYHDREWQRNSVCQDPHTSPGLPALTFRGELEGFWRGKFLFYDFDSYRQILAGNIRGVYTGAFSEQAAELEIRETVIRVRKDEVGGDGPMLCAGFSEEEEVDGDAGEAEQRRIREGYGHEVVHDEDGSSIKEEEEGWTREILLSGRCRSSWGWARIRGRVRSWDGLIVMAMSYSNHVMGRWLWRGYLHTGGYFIGRWRDTFTPENLRGYEGSCAMVRAGDIFYPPHFPQRMEDSLGVDHSAMGLTGTSAHGSSQFASHPSHIQAVPQQFPHGHVPPATGSVPAMYHVPHGQHAPVLPSRGVVFPADASGGSDARAEGGPSRPSTSGQAMHPRYVYAEPQQAFLRPNTAPSASSSAHPSASISESAAVDSIGPAPPVYAHHLQTRPATSGHPQPYPPFWSYPHRMSISGTSAGPSRRTSTATGSPTAPTMSAMPTMPGYAGYMGYEPLYSPIGGGGAAAAAGGPDMYRDARTRQSIGGWSTSSMSSDGRTVVATPGYAYYYPTAEGWGGSGSARSSFNATQTQAGYFGVMPEGYVYDIAGTASGADIGSSGAVADGGVDEGGVDGIGASLTIGGTGGVGEETEVDRDVDVQVDMTRGQKRLGKRKQRIEEDL